MGDFRRWVLGRWVGYLERGFHCLFASLPSPPFGEHFPPHFFALFAIPHFHAVSAVAQKLGISSGGRG